MMLGSRMCIWPGRGRRRDMSELMSSVDLWVAQNPSETMAIFVVVVAVIIAWGHFARRKA